MSCWAPSSRWPRRTVSIDVWIGCWKHKRELFLWLREKWADLFQADFEVLLYDLTSTYFEGEMEENPKAHRGYSGDGRPDCLQVVMDRGIPTEALLAEMRDPARGVFYLVGTPRTRVSQRAQVAGSALAEGTGLRRGKALRTRRGTRCWPRGKAGEPRRRPCDASVWPAYSGIRAMRRSLPARDALLLRLGAARKEAGHAFRFVHIQLPQTTAAVTRESFRFRLDKTMLQQAEQRDGHYLLRSNLTAEDPTVLWTRFVQLTQIEAAFRTLKSELGIRPIYHRLEHRIDAHILMAFLAYCPQVTLKNRLLVHAPGLTPHAVLEKLQRIQMIDVWIPTLDGRRLPLHAAGTRDQTPSRSA
jgi:hypothetical protein